jgi:hypothetical protein
MLNFSVFHKFKRAQLAKSDSILSLSRFLIMPKRSQKQISCYLDLNWLNSMRFIDFVLFVKFMMLF